ncbi:MAG: DUF2125 domain-containing protein, partial [Rhodobacteraceae bacterium]|nr:DUF2125 domain-containing protein [Paracoccaceae bacterium]
TFPQIVFSETGDGSVDIQLPEVTTFVIDGQDEDDDFTATVEFAQSGLNMNVSGTPEKLVYAYTADMMSMKLANLLVDDTPVDSDVARVAMTLSGISGETQASTEGLRAYAQTLNANNLTLDLFVTDPEEADATAKIETSLDDLVFSGSGNVPAIAVANGDINAMLDAGFTFASSMTFGAGASDIAFNDGEEAGTINSTSEGGAFTVSMSEKGLAYDLSQRNQSMNMLISDVPFPISAEMAESGASLMMPVKKSDDPQDFGFGLTLRDFKMSDSIWAMVDPGQQFPRDPATIVLDLAGQAKVLFDFLDPATAEVMETTGAIPGELLSLTLKQLLVQAVGAKLSGEGDFTFDNSDMSSFDGFPRPNGAVTFQLDGANALLDKLIAMGIVSNEDAQGARFMMGLFARPGEGPDSLVSTVEVNDEGHVLANGQRIR